MLQSLSLGRDGNRVLIRFDSKKNVTTEKKRIKERKVILPHDTFHFNHNFSSKMFRIKIPSLQVRETAQERDETHQSVSRDRLYLIDAAIVRIMKARKTISHQALLGEVMNQLRFSARRGSNPCYIGSTWKEDLKIETTIIIWPEDVSLHIFVTAYFE